MLSIRPVRVDPVLIVKSLEPGKSAARGVGEVNVYFPEASLYIFMLYFILSIFL